MYFKRYDRNSQNNDIMNKKKCNSSTLLGGELTMHDHIMIISYFRDHFGGHFGGHLENVKSSGDAKNAFPGSKFMFLMVIQ